jgi:hypothetical protein
METIDWMKYRDDSKDKIQQLEKEAKEQDKIYRDLQKFAVSLEKENAIYKSENEMLRESFKHVEDMSFEVYKENTDLKSKLASIKTLNRQEVEKIIDSMWHKHHKDFKQEAITAILDLALPEIDKDRIDEIFKDLYHTICECSTESIETSIENAKDEIIKLIKETQCP